MRIRLSLQDILIVTVGLIYIVFFYSIFNIDTESIPYSVLHSILASICLIVTMNTMEAAMQSRKFSLALIFLFTSSIYSSLSSTKYILRELYNGYIQSRGVRLSVSIGSMLVIIFLNLVWRSKSRKRRPHDSIIDIINEIRLNSLFVWIVSIICATVMLGMSLYELTFSSNSTLSTQITEIIEELGLLICLVNVKRVDLRGKTKLEGFSSMFPIFIAALMQSAITGSRHFLIIPALILLSSLISLNRVYNLKTTRIVLAFLPFVILMFSTMIFMISGRHDIGSDSYIREVIYRFDLTDLAATEAMNTEYSDYSFRSIAEAVEFATPGVFSNIDKQNIKNDGQYKYILRQSGLYTEADYNDTIFSMGSEIAGFIGCFCLPIIIFLWLDFIDKWITNWKLIGDVCKLSIIPYFCSVETEWKKFFLDTRTYFLVLITTYLVINVLLKKKIREKMHGSWQR